jgi:putative oxidoreductase
MKKTIAIEIVSYLFTLLFVYTGLMKLIDHYPFYGALTKSHLLYHYAQLLEWLIPAIELGIALSLMVTKTRRFALYCSLCLMSMFTIYVGYTVFFMTVRERPCTCGGIIQEMNWTEHFYFNIFFTLLALVGVLLHKNKYWNLTLQPVT